MKVGSAQQRERGPAARASETLRVLRALNEEITACRRCPRLIEHCTRVAVEKRASYRDERYWGRPVPNFLPEAATGDAGADTPIRLLLVGLAPGAHGANRTGRMFTGDRSGDFLFAALHAVGLASQPTAVHAADGLVLRGMAITGAGHCAPPGNRPLPAELDLCRPFLARTLDALPDLRVAVTLGGIAHEALLKTYSDRGWWRGPRAAVRFAHGACYRFETPGVPAIFACYHPSQQNTFTGRLTQAMLRQVLASARDAAGVE